MRAFLTMTAKELEEKWAKEDAHFSKMEDDRYRLERIYSRLAEIQNALWRIANKSRKRKTS